MRTLRIAAIVATLTAAAAQPAGAWESYAVPRFVDLVRGSSVMIVSARRLDVAREQDAGTRTTWHSFRIEETLSQATGTGMAQFGKAFCRERPSGVVVPTGEIALPFIGVSASSDASSFTRSSDQFRPDTNRRYLLLATNCGDGTGRLPAAALGLLAINADGTLRPSAQDDRLPYELPDSLPAVRELIADLARYEADAAAAGLLVGRIVDAVTSQPVADAQVRLRGVTETAVRASDDGWFVFRDVRAFTYDLSVTRPGWVEQRQRIRVTAAERRADIAVALNRAPGLHGTVREEDGRPFISARVHALEIIAASDGVRTGRSYEVRTDDRGRYTFNALNPGDYVLYVDVNTVEIERDDRADRTFYPPSFHPGGTAPFEASPVSLLANDSSREIDFVIRPVPMRTVMGTVRAGGLPVANALLQIGRLDPLSSSLSPERTFRLRTGQTMADGTFVFDGLAPGEYLVSLVAENTSVPHAIRRVDVTRHDAAAVNFDELKMPRRGASRPAVNVPRGTARLNGIVADSDQANPAHLSRTLVTVTNLATKVVRKVQTDTRGTFQLTRLAAGRYELSADRDGYISLTSVGYGDPPLVVNVGEGEVVSATLTMRRGGVVSGVVYDESGNPAAGRGVLPRLFSVEDGVPMMRDPRRFQFAGGVSGGETDSAGRYRIFGVPPGEYVLAVSPKDVSSSGIGRTTREDVEQALADVRAIQYLTSQASAPGMPPALSRPTRPVASAIEERGRLPVFYPGTVDPLAGERVKVDAGSELTALDISLIEAWPVTVSGVLRFEAGAPRTNVRMTIERIDIGGGASLGLSMNGDTFTARRVAPGRYLVIARTEPAGADRSLYMSGRTIVDVSDSDVEGVVVTLHPTAFVSGRLVPPQGLPLGSEPIIVSVEPVDRLSGDARMVRAAADGTFTLRGVPPGRYRFRLQSGGGVSWTVNGVDVAGQPLPGQILAISAGGGPPEMAVHLGTR